ncbi:MAG: hypothetical protein R3F30_08865 [Planctomycetota bacterium]
MKRSRPLGIAGLVAAIAIGGCGRDEEPGKGGQGPSARAPTQAERERLHLDVLAGDRPDRLDRAVLDLVLGDEETGKTQVTASLARTGRARLVLREADEFARTAFLGPDGVHVGPADGPWVPLDGKAAERLCEVADLCAAILAWDLRATNDAATGGRKTAWSGRPLRRDLTADGRLEALVLGERRYRVEGRVETAFGELPARLVAEGGAGLGRLSIERGLLDARFRAGLLEPERAGANGKAVEVAAERRDGKPSLAEYPAFYEVDLGEPADLDEAVRILTQEVPGRFHAAGLEPTGLPVFVEGSGLRLGVRRADGKVPEAPDGYGLARRDGRVSAYAFVEARWDEAAKRLHAVLDPYLRRMGLEARGALWISPYLELGSISEAPAPETRLVLRGEIRVR